MFCYELKVITVTSNNLNSHIRSAKFLTQRSEDIIPFKTFFFDNTNAQRF